VPGFIDTHVHYPQIRILGTLGHSLLDWLKKQTLPEEAKFANPDYAQAVPWDFCSRADFSRHHHGAGIRIAFCAGDGPAG
jgi:cytosine/adenosine deaminase-related metal-dependent hydrolase